MERLERLERAERSRRSPYLKGQHADLLTFGEAVQRAGVSRQRLNRAIHSGRLPAERGGGPGKPIHIRFEDLQAWCASEGRSMPAEMVERLERPERSADTSSDLARLEAWQAFCQREGLHIPDAAQMAERSERSMPAHGLPPSPQPVMSEPKAAVLQRLQAMKAEGLSLQKIADRLNYEGVPMLCGKGRRQKGTIGHLLAQGDEA